MVKVGQSEFHDEFIDRILCLTDILPEKIKRIAISPNTDDDYDFVIHVEDDWDKFDEYLESLVDRSEYGQYNLYIDIDDQQTLDLIKTISTKYNIGRYFN